MGQRGEYSFDYVKSYDRQKKKKFLTVLVFLLKYEVAVKRVLVAKFGACGGQACIAVDYVLVEKSFSSTLVRSLKEYFYLCCSDFEACLLLSLFL